MEPLTTAAIAIGAVVGKKALEKTGEKIGEALSNKIGKFLSALKKQSPQTITAIEQAQEQPLDYGQAIREVEVIAQANPEVNQTMEELAVLAQDNPPPNLAEILSEIKKAVENSQQSYPATFIQNIGKAINAAQTQTIDQRNSTFNL
jgi:hypothetical protein